MNTIDQRKAIYELSLALKLTQEYVGDNLLPRLPGWSWFDALTEHAPEMLEQSPPLNYDSEDTSALDGKDGRGSSSN